jgi:hypothetical protein
MPSILPNTAGGGSGKLTALVPGAGRSYDALTLSSRFSTTAVDLSSTACEEASKWLSTQDGGSDVKVTCGDFFNLDVEPVDVIWDCTFLCALDPSVRSSWASKTASLLKDSGELVTLVFPISADRPPNVGPPYALTVQLVADLLKPHNFESIEVIDMPVGTHMPSAPFGNAVVRWRRKKD